MEALLTIAEAAKVCAVSEKTVRRAISNGHLEAGRLGEGGGLRVKPSALEAWFEIRSTLHEPRTLKPVPVLPPIGPRVSQPRQPQRGKLRLSDHRKAA